MVPTKMPYPTALAFVLMLGGSVASGNAQQRDAATGSVTGHVIAQDTARPVRFAQVMLQSVAAVTGEGREERGFNGGTATRTGADGDFYAGSVAPGDYYVTATTPGYVSERSLLQAAVNAGGDPTILGQRHRQRQLQAAVNAGGDPTALLGQVPIVHVAAGEASSITVTLERGGTISGRVQWEDGSPATGVSLNAVSTLNSAALPGSLQNFQSAGGGNFAVTDDRGAFRIAGLPAGDYLIRSQIQTSPAPGSSRFAAFAPPIRLYSPGVFHKADAKAISVKAGEERGDVRMTIDLRDLRTVSGHAASANAGQSVASGRVSLVDPNDGDLQLGGSVSANGDFAVRYVPPGNYTLRIIGASTLAASGRNRESDSSHGTIFQAFSQAVAVTDADLIGVSVTLTPVTAQPAAP
jgi:hypothetical protein